MNRRTLLTGLLALPVASCVPGPAYAIVGEVGPEIILSEDVAKARFRMIAPHGPRGYSKWHDVSRNYLEEGK